MRTISRTRACAEFLMAALALGIVAVAAGIPGECAVAQSVQRAQEGADPKAAEAEAAKKKEAALRAFDAGTKAFQAGKMDPAIKSLTGALGAGGLASPEIAKALYYRGLAYRKQNKLPQAISDLTSAIWLKKGLPEAERSAAMEARAAAYRDAGVNQGEALPWTGGGKPTASGESAPPPSAKWQTATTDATDPATPAPSTPPPETKPAELNEGSGIGGFFSNLFGGSSSSAKPPEAKPPPAPAPAAPAPAESKWTSSTEPAVSSWSDQTTVSEPPAKKVAAVEPPKEPAHAAASGKYRLQIATVRTREDADEVAKRVRSEHGAQLGSATLAVDETVVGNMGTFFRVQAGPFRTAEDSEKACKALRASGYDCLVVTR